MDLHYKDIIHPISIGNEIFLYYMDIPAFMKKLAPKKEITDFSIKKDHKFYHHDFKIAFLSECELNRLNGYKSFKKQIEWIAGRFLVKNMVKYFVDSDVELPNVKISYKEEGAPFLEQFPTVAVSITHSGNYAAAALSKTYKNIGIDIEKSDYQPAESFMKIAFTDKEIADIELNVQKKLISQKELSENNRIYNFEEKVSNNKLFGQEVMRRWTLKEAFLKYIGKGFNEKLKSVEIVHNTILYNGKDAINITIDSFNIDEKYLLSIIYG